MPTSDELKTLGNEAFSNKEYKKAAKIYRDAISLLPGNPVLYANRAIAFIKLEDWPRALRDCEKGLEVNPDLKTKVKLLYRKGLALGLDPEAREVFKKVLELDPNNVAALEKVKERNNQDTIDQDAIDIPVELVSELPAEFQQNFKMADTSTAAVDSAIQELFPEKPKPTPTQTEKFTERPSMQLLSTIHRAPESERTRAYEYVINLPPLEYKTLFKYGLDADFLAFYIEAAAYVSTHDTVDQWASKILNSLKTLSQLKRYTLSLELCDKGLLTQLKSNFEDRMEDVTGLI